MLATRHRLLSLAVGAAALLMASAASAQDPAPEHVELTTGAHSIVLPADGILRYASLTVRSGAEVTFVRNLANTPVFMLSTGPIDIENGAVIRLDGTPGNGATPGSGGPGGFGGGNPGPWPAGNGEGPGGGKGGCPHYECWTEDRTGHGAYGCDGDGHVRSGTPYGNPVLLSLVGGSGGGGTSANHGGGGGGGAILLSSQERITLNGRIQADGGIQTWSSAGSGGAIRLRAPIVSGTGTLQVNGPVGNHGRIRVDALDRSGIGFSYNPPCAVTTGSVMSEFVTTGTLRITAVGGQVIPGDATGPVLVTLAADAPKTVTVRANGFGGIIPVEVALTPDQSARLTKTISIDMGTADVNGNASATATFDEFPPNQAVRVDAWTR